MRAWLPIIKNELIQGNKSDTFSTFHSCTWTTVQDKGFFTSPLAPGWYNFLPPAIPRCRPLILPPQRFSFPPRFAAGPPQNAPVTCITTRWARRLLTMKTYDVRMIDSCEKSIRRWWWKGWCELFSIRICYSYKIFNSLQRSRIINFTAMITKVMCIRL